MQLDKLSDSVWVLRDGATSLVEVNSALNTVRVNSDLKLGTTPVYKVARGEVTLDGGNPTVITTGLAAVVACTVTDKRATAPAADPTAFTVDYGGGVTAGTVNLYAWKITANDNGTLVASTDNDDVVSWIAVGT